MKSVLPILGEFNIVEVDDDAQIALQCGLQHNEVNVALNWGDDITSICIDEAYLNLLAPSLSYRGGDVSDERHMWMDYRDGSGCEV